MRNWDMCFWYDNSYIQAVEAFVLALGDNLVEIIWHDDYVEIIYTA